MTQWTKAEAAAIVESLRYGTPPVGHVREFTVGREPQLRELAESFASSSGGNGEALLVRANYGAGKSHLLRIVQEEALDSGYAVALVVTDATGGVRFNRMDTIFAAVAREVEIQGGERGFADLFDEFARAVTRRGLADPTVKAIMSAGSWSATEAVCDPIFIGLRAWVLGKRRHHDIVTAWYTSPEAYRDQRSFLWSELCAGLSDKFVERRSEPAYYINGSFSFHSNGHENAWAGLRDLHTIARVGGYKGLILLFDEFEDVIQNLNRVNWQEAAFRNLFTFFGGGQFPSKAYFAVTPDFVTLCKEQLLAKGRYDFPVRQFDRLPAFELDPIGLNDFIHLAQKIAAVHGVAFGWDSSSFAAQSPWPEEVRRAWGRPQPDRIRQGVQRIVALLDDRRRAEAS